MLFFHVIDDVWKTIEFLRKFHIFRLVQFFFEILSSDIKYIGESSDIIIVFIMVSNLVTDALWTGNFIIPQILLK